MVSNIKALVVFALSMSSGEKILTKSPQYIKEKALRFLDLSAKEIDDFIDCALGLDLEKRTNYKAYIEKWGKGIDEKGEPVK